MTTTSHVKGNVFRGATGTLLLGSCGVGHREQVISLQPPQKLSFCKRPALPHPHTPHHHPCFTSKAGRELPSTLSHSYVLCFNRTKLCFDIKKTKEDYIFLPKSTLPLHKNARLFQLSRETGDESKSNNYNQSPATPTGYTTRVCLQLYP